MEQRDSITSPRSTSFPEQTQANNSDTDAVTESNRDPSLTGPLPAASTSSSTEQQLESDNDDDKTSSSELTLRFPRPQGNKRLAHWISASDPNIMATASENASESGLASSTYELINKEDALPHAQLAHTDSESQDDSQDVFDSSISESVGSLDQFRQDDVQSLASTDQMEEEEDGLHHHYDDDEHHDDASTAPDDEGSRLTEETWVNRSRELPVAQYPSDAEELSDAESRSSIEYTHQSLGTPSMLTPDASKILSPESADAQRATQQTDKRFQDDIARVGQAVYSTYRGLFYSTDTKETTVTTVSPKPPATDDEEAWEKYRNEPRTTSMRQKVVHTMHVNAWQYATYLASLTLGSILMVMACSARDPTLGALSPAAIEKTTTSTAIMPTTSLASITGTAQVADPTTGVALIPLYESHGDEWLFGYKVPSVSFTPEGDSGILINVEPSIPKTWTAQRECVKIHATRGEKTVPLKVDFTNLDAIHVGFAKTEAHGIVQIKLSSKCRPKFEKSVKVHFGKGFVQHIFDELADASMIFDRALTSAKSKADRMIWSGLSSATANLGPFGDQLCKAAEEASRRFHQAEGVLHQVSARTQWPLNELRVHATRITEQSMHSAEKVLGTVKDNVVGGASYAVRKAAASQQSHQAQLKQMFSGINMDDMQQQLRFGLLDAQVSAKAWWLKATGREAKSEEYRLRAKEFINELYAYSTHGSSSKKVKGKSWDAGAPKCKSKPMRRGQRGTHQCDPAT